MFVMRTLVYVCASVLANKDANCTVLEYKLITFHTGFKTVNSRYVFSSGYSWHKLDSAELSKYNYL